MGDIIGYAFIVVATIFFVYGIWVERNMKKQEKKHDD